jgi:hypothetical protein
VNVSGIPAACAGETLSVTLVGGGNAALATVTTTIGGTTATLTGFGTVSAPSLLGYAYAVTGA